MPVEPRRGWYTSPIATDDLAIDDRSLEIDPIATAARLSAGCLSSVTGDGRKGLR
jgi:hypothetical protein